MPTQRNFVGSSLIRLPQILVDRYGINIEETKQLVKEVRE